jgi:hypothetical protein
MQHASFQSGEEICELCNKNMLSSVEVEHISQRYSILRRSLL